MGRAGAWHTLYRIAWWPLLAGVTAWLWWRGRQEPAYRKHLMERWGRVSGTPSAMGGIWIHAASVGEVQAALTLLPELERAWGVHAVTWTVQTPAGRAVLLERTQGKAQVHYAPADHAWTVTSFLDRIQPRMLVVLERELWPEWLLQCERRHIPVALVNARLTERSARRSPGLQRVLLRPRLAQLACVTCADSASATRLETQGVPANRISTTGNLKFDGAAIHPAQTGHLPDLSARRVVVAASTHAGDEEVILKLWPMIAARCPQALLVLAPRHSPRFDEVAHHVASYGLKLVRRTRNEPVRPDTQVFLLDTIGELANVYLGAHVALMGGTWAHVGGHSPLEALARACPVLVGPNVHQFPDLYQAILAEGGGEQANAEQLADVLIKWLEHPDGQKHAGERAKAFWLSQQGASWRTLARLQRLDGWPQQPMDDVLVENEGSITTWWNTSVTTPLQRRSGFETEPQSRPLATGSGRGQVTLIHRQEQTWLLRHYRRGGLVAKWNPDRYPAQPVPQTRAMQEMTLLREMVSRGLPVPRPIAARCVKRGWHYKADIMVEYLPDTANVAQVLAQRPIEPHEWERIGETIRQMHNHQIFHSDLNCHNILLGTDGKVWIIDFDKCKRRNGISWKHENIMRLQRSLHKESKIRKTFFSPNKDITHLIDGYSRLAS